MQSGEVQPTSNKYIDPNPVDHLTCCDPNIEWKDLDLLKANTCAKLAKLCNAAKN